MKERKKILAFDIGGTKIAYALIDEKGKICGEITKVSTPRDSREILTTLKSVVSGFVGGKLCLAHHFAAARHKCGVRAMLWSQLEGIL